MSLCCKTKINTPTIYNVPNKDAMKYEIMPHLSLAKRGQMSKRGRAEAIPCGFHKLKTACRWQITSAFSWCCTHCPWQHALQPLEMAFVSVHAFGAVAHSRVFIAHYFCTVFSKKFNIMSALSIHQPPTLPQKINSREDLFWGKIGLACACGRMNNY